MADPKQDDHGEFARPAEVPVDQWIPHPVSDSADYLDRPDPIYMDDLPEEGDDGATGD